MVIFRVSVVGSTSKDHVSGNDSNSKTIIKRFKVVFKCVTRTALKIPIRESTILTMQPKNLLD